MVPFLLWQVCNQDPLFYFSSIFFLLQNPLSGFPFVNEMLFFKKCLDQGDICFCLPDSADGEACAATTSCSETVNQDTEASCLKTEAPKLLHLTRREKLTTAQLKVGGFCQ